MGRRGVVTALVAAAALCGPLAQSALADDITFSTLSRELLLTGTGAPDSQVTVGPGTAPMEYRFESTENITVDPSASAFCGPTPALVVECDDDPLLPAMPDDDIASIRVNGGGGDDTITASGALDSAASLLLEGGADDDTLIGGLRVETLSGGPGTDRVNGGPGADFINGDSGADAIEARDDEVDEIRCGTSLDSAAADIVDTFPGSDCEFTTIGFPPPPPPPPPTPAPPPPIGSVSTTAGPPIAIGVSAAFATSRRGTRIRRLTVKDLPAGIVVRVRCQSPSKRRGGAKCPFRLATIAVDRKLASLALGERFRGRRLAPRTIIRVSGAAAGRLGTSVRFKLRKARSPSRSDGCVNSALKRVSCLSVDPG